MGVVSSFEGYLMLEVGSSNLVDLKEESPVTGGSWASFKAADYEKGRNE